MKFLQNILHTGKKICVNFQGMKLISPPNEQYLSKEKFCNIARHSVSWFHRRKVGTHPQLRKIVAFFQRSYLFVFLKIKQIGAKILPRRNAYLTWLNYRLLLWLNNSFLRRVFYKRCERNAYRWWNCKTPYLVCGVSKSKLLFYFFIIRTN